MGLLRQGTRNRIDPSARIVGDVEIGSGNSIGPESLLVGPLRIGDENVFGPKSVVGTPAQDDIILPGQFTAMMEGRSEGFGSTVIGSGNVFREFSTVHRGLTGETRVGDNVFLMAYSHCPHDCTILDGAKVANNVQMGGYSVVGEGAYLGLSAVVVQFSVVGAYAMVGMHATVTHPVAPFSTVIGSPAKALKPNMPALRRFGIVDAGWWTPDHDPDATTMPDLIKPFYRDHSVRVAAAREQAEVVRGWRSQHPRLADG